MTATIQYLSNTKLWRVIVRNHHGVPIHAFEVRRKRTAKHWARLVGVTSTVHKIGG